MLIAALLAGFFASFAPFWGLLFLIAYGYRYYQENPVRFFGIFAIAAFISVLVINSQYIVISIYDAFAGAGLTAYFFLRNREAAKDLSWNILHSSIILAVSAFLRTLLFASILREQAIESSNASKELLMELLADNEEMLTIAVQSIDQSSKLLNNFSAVIWFFTLIFALYFAVFWQTSRMKSSQTLSSFTLPYWIVYPLIVSMVVFLIPSQKIAGANLLLMILPLLLFQGLAVSQVYLKTVFPQRNVNWYSFFLIIIFNYLYISFLVLIGILDIWMQFRLKLRNINSRTKINQ